MRPPCSPNTVNQSECRTTKMLPPSGQLLSESECRNLGHDPGKQDGGSATQCFEALLVANYPHQLSVFSCVCVSVCLFTGGSVQGPMFPAKHVQTCSLCNSYCRQAGSWHSNEMSFCCNCKDHHRTSIGCEK